MTSLARDSSHNGSFPATAIPSDDELKSHLSGSLRYYNRLLCMIPARHYIRPANEEAVMNKMYMKNLKNKAPKQSVKEATKKAKKSRGPNSKKLNPLAKRTILDVQEQQLEDELQEKRAKLAEMEANSEPVDSAVTYMRVHEKPREFLSASELQTKVAAKIEELRAKRNAPADGSKQRDKVANKRSKLKAKLKGKALVKGGVGVDGRPLARKSDSKEAKKAPPVVFSKFEFANDASAKRKKKSKPTPQQQLMKVQQEKHKMEQLRAENPNKAEEVEESQAWNKALQRAEGQKVFDSEKLVKKKIKAIEKKKAKSKKEWDERKAQVEKDKKERQDKRTKNLKAKADAKKQKKINKAKKRRPGF